MNWYITEMNAEIPSYIQHKLEAMFMQGTSVGLVNLFEIFIKVGPERVWKTKMANRFGQVFVSKIFVGNFVLFIFAEL